MTPGEANALARARREMARKDARRDAEMGRDLVPNVWAKEGFDDDDRNICATAFNNEAEKIRAEAKERRELESERHIPRPTRKPNWLLRLVGFYLIFRLIYWFIFS